MSPEQRRQLSRLLILRPHPWAYHPVPADHAASSDLITLPAVGDDPPPPASGWRQYLSGRFSALERQIQRLGHTPRDWLF